MAASGLCTAVQQYIEDVCNNIPRGTRIICRIYANVQGLGNILVRAGIIEHLGVFEDFVRGFSRGKTLFDFIDVGAGKDRADDKIIGTFRPWLGRRIYGLPLLAPSTCHVINPG
jgi:hypothetical protein